MKKIFIREKSPFYQKRYLPRLFQIAVVPVPSPDVLPGKELPRVKFQPNRLKGIGVERHFHIYPFTVLCLAVNVEPDLPVPDAVVDNRQFSTDEGGKQF
jgi:hypothetical protein